MRHLPVLLGVFLPHAEAHGNLVRLKAPRGQTLCSPSVENHSWCVPVPSQLSGNALGVRATLPRVELHSGDPDCDVPPGCELGCPTVTGKLPGLPSYEYCAFNHFAACEICAFEVVPSNKPAVTPGKNWTKWPAAWWDEPDQWPQYPCMSRAAFGSSGIVTVEPGNSLEATLYIQHDHAGLYRYELGCGSAAGNTDFFAGPLTPWKAMHAHAQLEITDRKHAPLEAVTLARIEPCETAPRIQRSPMLYGSNPTHGSTERSGTRELRRTRGGDAPSART